MGVYFFKQMILTKTNNNYTHELFGSLTTIINENNEVFFLAKDVCKILEFRDSNELTRRLDDDEYFKLSYEESKFLFKENKINSSGLIFITELGLYTTINRTNKWSSNKKIQFLNWLKSYGLFDKIKIYSPVESEFLCELEKALEPFDLNFERQLFCKGYKIDAYIKHLNIAIEFDENSHQYYSPEKEIERENIIKNELKCKFIRVSDKNTNSYNIGLVLKSIFNIN